MYLSEAQRLSLFKMYEEADRHEAELQDALDDYSRGARRGFTAAGIIALIYVLLSACTSFLILCGVYMLIRAALFHN